jgi:hypothetical protein
MAWQNRQRLIQRPGELDGWTVLLNILPLVYGAGHLDGRLVIIVMLPLQMLLDVRGPHAMLARAADDNPQAGDLLN